MGDSKTDAATFSSGGGFSFGGSSASQPASAGTGGAPSGGGFSFGGSSASQPASAGTGGAPSGGSALLSGSLGSQPSHPSDNSASRLLGSSFPSQSVKSPENALQLGAGSVTTSAPASTALMPSNISGDQTLSQNHQYDHINTTSEHRMLSVEGIISDWKSSLLSDAIRFEEQAEHIKSWDQGLRENQKVSGVFAY